MTLFKDFFIGQRILFSKYRQFLYIKTQNKKRPKSYLRIYLLIIYLLFSFPVKRHFLKMMLKKTQRTPKK
jgi:hypothetical protein